MAVTQKRIVKPRRRVEPRPDPAYPGNLVSFPTVENFLDAIFNELDDETKRARRRERDMVLRFLQLFPDEFITVVHNPKDWKKLLSLTITQPPPRP